MFRLQGLKPADNVIRRGKLGMGGQFFQWFSRKRFHGQCRRCRGQGFDSWVWKIPWRRAWQPTPVFLLGESHGQKSLGGGYRVGHD